MLLGITSDNWVESIGIKPLATSVETKKPLVIKSPRSLLERKQGLATSVLDSIRGAITTAFCVLRSS